jgi:hypothetical protein
MPTCQGRGVVFQLSVKEWMDKSAGTTPDAKH